MKLGRMQLWALQVLSDTSAAFTTDGFRQSFRTHGGHTKINWRLIASLEDRGLVAVVPIGVGRGWRASITPEGLLALSQHDVTRTESDSRANAD